VSMQPLIGCMDFFLEKQAQPAGPFDMSEGF
jgi:hypothetical protein